MGNGDVSVAISNAFTHSNGLMEELGVFFNRSKVPQNIEPARGGFFEQNFEIELSPSPTDRKKQAAAKRFFANDATVHPHYYQLVTNLRCGKLKFILREEALEASKRTEIYSTPQSCYMCLQMSRQNYRQMYLAYWRLQQRASNLQFSDGT